MLKVISYTHKKYIESNLASKWNETDSICLTATAAAQINRDADRLLLNVSQGINFNYGNIQINTIEVENAFTSAKYANAIYPGTVSSVVYYFGSEFNMTTHLGTFLKEFDQKRKEESTLGIKIGARIVDCSELISHQLHWPENTTLTRFLERLDFLVCHEIDEHYKFNPTGLVKAMEKTFKRYAFHLRQAHPSVSIILFGRWWPSNNVVNGSRQEWDTYNIENMYKYWTTAGKWAQKNNVEVRMYEAFDQPYGESILAHAGWWKLAEDDILAYEEKVFG